MTNNSNIKFSENWFITTGMPRQERKNTTEPCWARRIFTRTGNNVTKIGEKMRHVLSYNLYQNDDHQNKRSFRGAVAKVGPIFTQGPSLYIYCKNFSSSAANTLKLSAILALAPASIRVLKKPVSPVK